MKEKYNGEENEIKKFELLNEEINTYNRIEKIFFNFFNLNYWHFLAFSVIFVL